jgi:putative ABC transport system permease protein
MNSLGARSRLRFSDALRLGASGPRARPARALLAALGIAIGTAAIVAVLGVSRSSQADLIARLDRLGTNLLTVSPGSDFLTGRPALLPRRALGMIALIPPVQGVSSTVTRSATVRRTDKVPDYLTGGISVQAADLALLSTLGARVAEGAWLNRATARYPAVVLGAQAAHTLGIDRLQPPVAVWIGQRWFKVTGILGPVGLAPELDEAALIGLDAAHRLLGADTHATMIYVRTNPDQTVAVRNVLARTANPAAPEQVNVARPSDVLAARVIAKGAYDALLLGLGAIALVVGAIGIANVMVMSVLERRQEIGVRRALGANRRHITLQFSVEALLLSLLGAAAGILTGIAITAGYAHSRQWTTAIAPTVIIAALLAAIVVGLAAGLYPAIRAARIPPTEALRAP